MSANVLGSSVPCAVCGQLLARARGPVEGAKWRGQYLGVETGGPLDVLLTHVSASRAHEDGCVWPDGAVRFDVSARHASVSPVASWS